MYRCTPLDSDNLASVFSSLQLHLVIDIQLHVTPVNPMHKIQPFLYTEWPSVPICMSVQIKYILPWEGGEGSQTEFCCNCIHYKRAMAIKQICDNNASLKLPGMHYNLFAARQTKFVKSTILHSSKCCGSHPLVYNIMCAIHPAVIMHAHIYFQVFCCTTYLLTSSMCGPIYLGIIWAGLMISS